MSDIASFLAYSPSMEVAELDEAQTAAELAATMRGICETTYADGGHAIRGVHAKSHALLKGTLTILPNLPAAYAHGIFAEAKAYPVVMRFSTTPGDMLDDKVSTPRGLALKIIGVKGERLPGAAGESQDFLMVNGPAFQAPTAKAFLKSLKLLAATTDKAPGLKRAASALLRAAEAALESVGGESATLKALGGHPETHILGETFFSQVPMLMGPYMGKVSLAPVSTELAAREGQKVDLSGGPNGLRAAAADFFEQHSAEWALRVQLCTDLETMPIEDSSKPWPEDKSPYVTVARLTVDRQPSWTAARSTAIDDGLAFSPWHGITAHRPLGSIMRVRKASYELSSRFRAERNGVSMSEPATLDAVAD